jgi:hypothetical protein
VEELRRVVVLEALDQGFRFGFPGIVHGASNAARFEPWPEAYCSHPVAAAFQ